MTLDIKICGLRTEEAVDKAVALGASHIGFIFFPKSPRNIEPSDAGRLAERARGRAKIVAVTVNADSDTLDEIVDQLSPDMLQLHGSESPERVLNVKAVYGLPVEIHRINGCPLVVPRAEQHHHAEPDHHHPSTQETP